LQLDRVRPGDVLQLQGQLVLVDEIRPTDDGLLTLRLTLGPGRRSWTTAPMQPTAELKAAWPAQPGRQADRH
jgi:hypothetical protein